MTYYPIDTLRKLGIDSFAAAGVSCESATPIIEALLAAELDGITTHGFMRIPYYADQAISGKVNIHATPVITRPKAAVVVADACYGYAYPAIEKGLEQTVACAQKEGIAFLSVTRSHHCGALGYFTEKCARQGLLALAFANAPACMAPWGGDKPVLSTNPIAFSCPRKNDEPLVIDMSLSKTSRGAVQLAANKGEKIPDSWALDKDGNKTTDPHAAMDGFILPMGDAKGYALALMVEILAGTLTGSNNSADITSFFEPEGPPPGAGQLFILIDHSTVTNNFVERVDVLFGSITAQEGARLPGDKRYANRAKNLTKGIDIPQALYDELYKRAYGQ